MDGARGRRDFFISHAGPDAQWAAWVASVLHEAGLTAELDVWEWSAGTDFIVAMERAMRRADRVLALWSPAYFDRVWTSVEGRAAFAESQKAEGRLVPIVVEPCAIPALYQTLIRIDLGGLSESEARERLLAGVRGPSRPQGRIGFPGGAAAANGALADPGEPPALAGTAGTWQSSPAFPGLLPPVWGPVPARNLLFTGRGDLLGSIRQRFQPGSHSPVVALLGVGGAGKTQLAAEFAWREASSYDLVWWASASAPDELAAGLADLAAWLGHAHGTVHARAQHALTELGRRCRWLLIYDAADAGAARGLAAWIPPLTGHLLITTGDPRIRQLGAQTVEVTGFTRDETVTLLRRHVEDLPLAQADLLATELGDLPLAADQAGAYLADTGLPAAEYLQRLKAQPQLTLSGETVHHPSLAATVRTSQDRLAAESPGAARLLHQLAMLGPEPIPLAAIAGEGPRRAAGLPAAAPELLHDHVAVITHLALGRRTGTSLSLHRLVQALVRSTLTPEQGSAASSGAQELLVQARPGDPEEPAGWTAYAQIAPHVRALAQRLQGPGSAAFRELVLAVGWYLQCSAQAEAAHELARSLRLSWTQMLGADHPDTLRAAQRESAALPPRHPDAVPLELDTLARRRRTLGDDHPDTLTSANNLAMALADLGRHHEAHELDAHTYQRRHRTLGPEHLLTLRSANNLANRLAALGQPAEALAQHERTLAQLRSTVGESHPETLRTLADVARDLSAMGQLELAQETGQDALTRYRQALGADHRSTLAVAALLARITASRGDREAAARLAEDTLARQQQTLGKEHPETQSTAGLLQDLAPQPPGGRPPGSEPLA